MSSGSQARPYAPPGQQSLFSRFCRGCPVKGICGEADSDTACVLPSAYPAESLHPVEFVRRRRMRRELSFPEPPERWADALEGMSLTVAASMPDMLDGHVRAVDLKAAMSYAAKDQPAHRHGVAMLLGEDRLLERLWKAGGRYAEAFGNRFEVAVGPAYSTWWRHTPLDGLVAVNRTAQMAVALARHLPTIPTVCWRTETDLRRWAAWFSKRPPAMICVHASTRRGHAAWSWGIDGIRILAQRFEEYGLNGTSLLAYGPSTVVRIREIAACWPWRVVVASQHPYQLARSFRTLDDDLSERAAPGRSREDLVIVNAAEYERAAARSMAKARGTTYQSFAS